MNVINKIITLFTLLINAYKTYKFKKRQNDIVSHPTTEWLHKFGGEDKRKHNNDANTK